MAANVTVRGLVSAAIGVGTSEYAARVIREESLLGRIINGRRTSIARRDERQIVPKRVVVAWVNAACTI